MTRNPLPPLLPSPDPVQIAKWTGQIRLVLTVLAGAGIGVAWIPRITDTQISAYVGVALLLLPIGASVWSWFENQWNSRKANATVVASAVASAKATAAEGTARPVVVVPFPTPMAQNGTAARPVSQDVADAAHLITEPPARNLGRI
jgi:hypothetical protein